MIYIHVSANPVSAKQVHFANSETHLGFCRAAKVFHRDLKPKNILANSDCKLKICDFGLARPSFNDMPTTIFWTDYVATRYPLIPLYQIMLLLFECQISICRPMCEPWRPVLACLYFSMHSSTAVVHFSAWASEKLHVWEVRSQQDQQWSG